VWLGGESRDRKPSPARWPWHPATSESLLDQLAVRLAGTGGPLLVASRSEIGWPKSVAVLLALAVLSQPVVVLRSRRTPRDQQKCRSVPDFRRTRCSLQFRRVKWTHLGASPMTLIHFTLAVTRTCKEAGELTREE